MKPDAPRSIPSLLLRILLLGCLYGVSSERKLVEELRMYLASRWFTGLGFDQEIPHHSTFSKNRHGRFQESKLFEDLFEQIVRQCVEVGLVQGSDERWLFPIYHQPQRNHVGRGERSANAVESMPHWKSVLKHW